MPSSIVLHSRQNVKQNFAEIQAFSELFSTSEALGIVVLHHAAGLLAKAQRNAMVCQQRIAARKIAQLQRLAQGIGGFCRRTFPSAAKRTFPTIFTRAIP